MLNKFILLILINSIAFSNNTYYNHKVSQFKYLSMQTNKHIAMIGDSITDRGLWNELTNRNDIINRGISGDTTNGVFKRMWAIKIAFIPYIVSIDKKL